jgi:hypothetical protein
MKIQRIKFMEKGLLRGRTGRSRLQQGCAEKSHEPEHDLERLAGAQR